VWSHPEIAVLGCEQKRNKTVKITVKYNENFTIYLGAFENPSLHDRCFVMNFLTVTYTDLLLDEYNCMHLFIVCPLLFQNIFSQT